jgi:hypothetical protein
MQFVICAFFSSLFSSETILSWQIYYVSDQDVKPFFTDDSMAVVWQQFGLKMITEQYLTLRDNDLKRNKQNTIITIMKDRKDFN